MRKHEKHCTMNPERECRMCVHVSGGQSHTVGENIEAARADPIKLEYLREMTESCPACIFAALRQGKFQIGDRFGPEGMEPGADFNYSTECKEFWDEVRREDMERMGNCPNLGTVYY